MVNRTSRTIKIWLAGLLMMTVAIPAEAKTALMVSVTDSALDATALIQLETQADNAKPREKCYLYTQLLTALMDTASRQVAAGEDEAAGKTVERIVGVTTKLQRVADRDAKKLKDAEKMLSETSRRLKDLSRVSGTDEREGMRAALEKLDAVHNKILALVFSQ